MNIDKNLINRALQDAGQEPLTEEDVTESTTRWRTCESFYLPLLLEMLAAAEWTGQKARATLELSELENQSEYGYKYVLPVDCAKPVEIQNNEEYIVEGKFLYTNVAGATLVYVSNHRRTDAGSLPEVPKPGDRVYVQGLYYQYSEELNDWEVIEEDFPGFDDFELAPEEAKCFEYALAAKIALKITGDKNLYQLLFSISENVKDDCKKQSRSQGVSRQNGDDWWGETLGLSSGRL